MPPTNLFGLGYGVGPAGYGYPSVGSVAPPTLSYASPQSWTYGAAITTLSPTTTGATSFAVNSGTLPTGVSLNAATGELTGTPTTAKVAANVVIRATGPGGTADATINIAVPSPLYTSLIEYWNLDEASGNRAGSHAGLTLTDVNTVTSQATGGPDGGRCAQFTRANSEYLSRASETALQTGDIDFSVAAWVYLDALTANQTIMGRYSGSASPCEYVLAFDGTNFKFFIFNNDSDADAVVVSATTFGTPSTGAWHYVVAWHDAAANTINISVDGGATDSQATAGKAPIATASLVQIGAILGGATWNLDGREAYLAFLKRKLTANERNWLYNSGAGRAYSALATYDGG